MERVRNRPRHEVTHTVIPESELFQLRHSLRLGDEKKQTVDQREREMLKQKSEARVKNWPNTIEALRLRKEVERKERLAHEEELRCAMDAEEAKYQAAMREAAIERANLMLYEQDDRIKTLNSKMLLSNVLEERQKQIELQEQRKELERQKEAAWTAQVYQQVHEGMVREEQERQNQLQKAYETQKLQKDQQQERRQQASSMRKEATDEGQRIRQAAERALQEDLEAEQRRRQEAKAMIQEHRQVGEQRKQIKSEQERLNQQEEAKMEQFAKTKEAQLLERKRRLAEKFRNDQSRRDVQIDQQAVAIEALRAKEEERINRQIEQVAAETEKLEREKQEKREKEWNVIVESRNKQLMSKQTKKEREEADLAVLRSQQLRAAEFVKQEDLKERAERQDSCKRLFQFHQMQREDKKSKEQVEKEQDRIEGEMMKKALEDEEEMFSRYVNTVMAEYTAKGRDASLMRSLKRRGDTM